MGVGREGGVCREREEEEGEVFIFLYKIGYIRE